MFTLEQRMVQVVHLPLEDLEVVPELLVLQVEALPPRVLDAPDELVVLGGHGLDLVAAGVALAAVVAAAPGRPARAAVVVERAANMVT